MSSRHLLTLLILLLWVGHGWADSHEKAVDYTGFWKNNCSDPFGIQIMPFKDGLYTTRFCGPGGGCNTPPDPSDATSIESDERYEVVSPSEIKEKTGDTVYGVLHKCTSETNPVLKYSDEDIAEGQRNTMVAVSVHALYLVMAAFVYRLLRRRLTSNTPFKTRVVRSGVLAILFSPGLFYSFPFTSPTFALMALVFQVAAAVNGNILFVLPQLVLSGGPILATWALLLGGGTLYARIFKDRADR